MNKPSDSQTQQHFKEYIRSKRFAELAKLIEKNQIKPAEYIVRMGYKQYMEEVQGQRVKLFYIMKLKEITGIPPDIKVLKDSCEISLQMDTPEILEVLIKRLEIKKECFIDLNATIQKTYQTLVVEGKFVDISKLIEITGVAPNESIIQEGYEKYLEEGKFISFSGLKKRTGIEPDEGLILDMYSMYHFNYIKYKGISKEQAEMWMERIKKLKRISKIEPPENIKIEEESQEESPPVEE